MLPFKLKLPEHYKGDSWPGFVIGPVTLNGVSPPASVSSCRLQFRDKDTDELGYELTTESPTPDDKGIIFITGDPADWLINIPTQLLPLNAGKWKWDFETTNAQNSIQTLFTGILKIKGDVTY